MKSRKLLLEVLAALTLVVTSCNKTSDSSFSESENETSSINNVESENESSDIVSSATESEEVFEENDNYYLGISNDDALANTIDFSITSNDENSILNLKIDNQEVKPNTDVNWNLTLYYETFGCNSDNVNEAADFIYLNGVSLGKLPSDGSKGIILDVLKDNILFGENIITITIGEFWTDREYNYSGPNKGYCDDFQIGKMYFLSNTLEKIYADKMVEYKWENGSKKTYNEHVSIPDKDTLYYIGDGWSGGLAYDNNPNEGYNIPQKIDFYFTYNPPEAINSYTLDTTLYEDGKHLFEVYDEDTKMLSRNVYIDNNVPTITCNLEENNLVNQDYVLTYKMQDATTSITKSSITLDGNEITSSPISFKDLNDGKHSIMFTCYDAANNFAYLLKEFEISSFGNYLKIKGVKENNKINFSLENNSANNVTLSLNKISKLDYASTSKVDVIENFSSSNPEQLFNVEVKDISKPVYISYTGKGNSAQDIISLEIYNESTKKYEEIGKNYSSMPINVSFNVNNDYLNSEGLISLKASIKYVNNGCNKLLWASDTQYFPKAEYTDLNPFYDELMEYVSEEYQKGNIAYFSHTGDIVDEHPSNVTVADNEWKIATSAFEILDENNVPYGVCAGNHDVDDTLCNYSLYLKYFDKTRYNDKPYYGGTYNNNENHYDLITFGNYDFIILYIGFGTIADKNVVNWANDVLAKYPSRNAIIATHAYLESTGTKDLLSYADIMYNEIVAKNDNVRFTFSGHTDGSLYIKQNFDNHDVYEILNCYQCVEKETYSIEHIINGWVCNGEGYMKSLEFSNDKVICKTFSPITNKHIDPYGTSDTVTLDIDLIEANHTLTLSNLTVCQIDEMVNTIDLKDSNYANQFENLNDNNYLLLASSNNNSNFIIL